MSNRRKLWIKFLLVTIIFLLTALISYPKEISKPAWLGNFLSYFKINLGLDLQGGIHLVYKADVSAVDPDKVGDAMMGLQDVIERRVNAFGVAEPLIETSKSAGENRLIVELAGVKDIEQAKEMIKETPFLEFKTMELPAPEASPPLELSTDDAQFNEQQKQKAEELLKQILNGADFSEIAKANSEDPGSKDQGGDLGFVKKGTFVPEFDQVLFESSLQPGQVSPQVVETQFGFHIIKLLEVRGEGDGKEVHAQHILLAIKMPPMPEQNPTFTETGLSGKNLKNASVEFDPQTGKPQVGIEFDSEGTKMFAQVTKENVGKQIAIFLDGQVISAPTVQAEISDGKAVITGSFSIDEAKKLSQRLNEGALPVPITLISQQSVEASLGQVSLEKSLKAGFIGLILVMVFMISYYRLLGLIASAALVIYTTIMVSIFKISIITPWSITLTLAGIAGFILSVGMAVDANILIFERTKEEIKRGRSLVGSIDEGFKRAWPSIRDSNISSIITSLILIWFGTGFVKGFAVTLLIGVLVSMFTAIVIVRTILSASVGKWAEERKGLILTAKKSSEGEVDA